MMRLFNWFRRRSLERGLDRELQYHFDRRVADFTAAGMPYPICRDLQQQTRLFDGVLCRAEIQVNLTAGGDPRPVAAEIVSGSYFPVLGVGPALGRVIEPEDDAAPGAGPVVVLSYDFWQAQFGGAADIVGRKVLVGNRPMTVAGVAAAGFRGVDVGAVPAFWIPTDYTGRAISKRDGVSIPLEESRMIGGGNEARRSCALGHWG